MNVSHGRPERAPGLLKLQTRWLSPISSSSAASFLRRGDSYKIKSAMTSRRLKRFCRLRALHRDWGDVAGNGRYTSHRQEEVVESYR